MPPFEFYAWVLGADGGRARMLARLGPDAVEPIEAFLGQTLAYEQGHPAAMESFLHWLGLGSDELKRDPEQARDVVRVTTVHGAKGLEAPIVFLADAGPRGRARRGRLLWSDPAPDGTDVELPLWRAARAERDGLTEAHRRPRGRGGTRGAPPPALRGADPGARSALRHRLAVAAGGAEPTARPDDAGADLARAGAPGAAGRRRTSSGARARRGRSAAPAPRRGHRGRTGDRVRCTGCRSPLPAWAHRAACPSEPAPPALTPSQAEPRASPPPSSPVGATASTRFQRGLLVHRLLQLLPELPPARPAGGGRAAARRARAEMAPEPPRRASPERAGRCWRGRTSPPCSGPAAGPSSRSAAWSAAGRSSARSTGWWSPRTRCWSSTTRATARRRHGAMPARSPICGSSRPTGRC